MYEQQCTFYFVDKCDLFWVFCRWNPLQLFWTLNLCFTNPVSRSEIFSTKCIAYANNKMISILTDPKWYPARQSLRLDPSAFLFVLSFPCDGLMSHKIIRSYLDLSVVGYHVSQSQSVSGMKKFCKHFLLEPPPVFTSVTSDHSSHGELWVRF